MKVEAMIVIRGGRGDISTGFLEVAGEQILRAKTSGSQLKVSLDFVQQLVQEVLRYRRQEATDVKEIEEIVKALEEDDSQRLIVSSSRKGPLSFAGLEIEDLDQLGGGSSAYKLIEGPTPPKPEVEPDPEPEIEELTQSNFRRPALVTRRPNFRATDLNYYRVLAISILGFLVIAGLALLGS